MINEILISFSNQIKKSRNPFFGTFIIVWIIRNWQFLITLFYLNQYPTMDEKFSVLQNYFADRSVLLGFFNTAWISLLAITVSYFLLNASRVITNLFENRLTPFIHKITAPKTIVLKSLYEQLMHERDKLETKFDEERKKRVDVQSDRDNLDQQLKELRTQSVLMPDPASVLNKPKENAEIKNIFEQMEGRNLLPAYIGVIDDVLYGNYIDNKTISPFLKLGLLSVTNTGNTTSKVSFTDKGKALWDFLVKNGRVS